jgi:XRE family transcriptional regulator, fatty acid utilization regulator
MARTLIGQRIRDHRKARGWTQAALAAHLHISPSYLNLIESDRRNIAGALLKRIADALDRPVEEFDGAAERRLVDDLGEIAADAAVAPLHLPADSAADLVARHPGWARALVALHRSGRDRQEAIAALSDRLSQDPFLGDAVHSLLTNLTAIRSASEILESVADLEPAQRKRFVAIIAGDSRRMSDVAQALAAFLARAPAATGPVTPVEEVDDFIFDNANHFPALEAAADSLAAQIGASPTTRLDAALASWLRCAHAIDVRAGTANGVLAHRPGFDRAAGVLELPDSAGATTRLFAMALAAAELACGDAVAAELDRTARLGAPAARRRAERVLFSYVAGALVMPYAAFQPAAAAARYDIDLLGRRFGASFEQVCHRLATLRRPGSEGIHFGFMRVDPAGFVTKRLALPGLALPRYGNACPLWAVYGAFRSPGAIVRQLVEFSGGERYLMIARTVEKDPEGFGVPPRLLSVMLFCDALHADRTVYGGGLDLGASAPATAVGQSCRTCARRECGWRQEDPIIDAGMY